MLAARAENMHFPCPEWEPTATIGTAGYPVAAVFPLWIAPKSGQPQTQGLEEASRRLRRTGCCPGQRPTRKRFAIGTSSSLSSRRWGSWEEPSQVSFLGQFGWSSTDSRRNGLALASVWFKSVYRYRDVVFFPKGQFWKGNRI